MQSYNRKSPRIERAGALVLALVLGTIAIAGAAWPSAARRPTSTSAQGRADARAEGIGGVSLAARLDRESAHAGGDGLVRMELVAQSDQRVAREAQSNRDVIVLIDRSGSMGGSKMEFAKRAVTDLVAAMGEDEQVALVAFDGVAEVLLPLTRVDRGAKGRVSYVIENDLRAGGGTNLQAGLEEARSLVYQRAWSRGRPARVVLISDGNPTVGERSHAGLRRSVRSLLAGAGPAGAVVSCIGVGSDYDYAMLTGLAQEGSGNYYYLERGHELREVLASELFDARATVATNVTFELELAEGVEFVDAGGFHMTRIGPQVQVHAGALLAEQPLSAWVSLRVRGGQAEVQELAKVALGYVVDGTAQRFALSEPLRVNVVKEEERFLAGIRPAIWEAAETREAMNALRRAVADDVRDNHVEKAFARLRAYRAEVGAVNARVASKLVTEKLGELERLEQQIREHGSTGAGRNAFSQSQAYQAEQARRHGGVRRF